MGADCVEEVSVMADDDDGVVEVGKEVFEPVHRLQIEVVRRLVQKQDVGIAEQRLGKQDADLEIVLDLLHLPVMQVGGDAKTVQHLRRLALGLPASHLGELRLEFGGPETVLLAEVLLGVYLIPLLHHGIQLVVTHDDGLEYSILVECEVVLSEDRHSLARSDDHLSAVGLDLAGEYLHECGLSCSVGTDDAIAVARRELDVHVLEQYLGSIRKGNVASCNHQNSPKQKKCSTDLGSCAAPLLVPRGIEPLFRD